MLMNLNLEKKQISYIVQQEILEQLKEDIINEGAGFDEYVYMQLMNNYIVDTLIENNSFKVYLNICGLDFKNYEYMFYDFLDRIHDIYDGINEKNDFMISMYGQGFERSFRFYFKDGYYCIKSEDYMENIEFEINEIIGVEELKKVIDSVRLKYILIIESLFSEEDFKKYVKYFKKLNFVKI